MPKALITGANSGIGKELSRQLALKGYNITLHVRNKDKAIDFLEGDKISFDVIAADLSNQEERKLLLTKIIEESYDLVINNAGFGLYGPIDSHTLEEEKSLLEVNINALFEIIYKAIESFKKHNKKGVILNVSSVAAFISPFPYFSSYAASKAFVLSLSKSLDAELKKEGIRVLVSCPGQVNTPFRVKASKYKSAESTKTMSASFAAKTMIKQIENGKRVSIFSFSYRIMLLLFPLIPSSIIEAILRANINKRIE
jgi:short-subunit dehydrogenase